MSRTIITHGCTQLMVCSMLVFGGETLFYFALALTIGICFGIYSSVLVGSPLLMWLGVSREDLVKPERRKESRRLRRGGLALGRSRAVDLLRRLLRPRSSISTRHLQWLVANYGAVDLRDPVRRSSSARPGWW